MSEADLILDTVPPQDLDLSYAPEDEEPTGVRDVDKATQRGLDEVRLMTQMIREHQAAIVALGRKRRTRVMRLREKKVTYHAIAEAMGTSDQAVYKVIRGDL